MATKSLRRLASDHASLYKKGLPPNYLFSPSYSDSNLTSLAVLLAGPEGTPYSTGVFRLELNIPPMYPQQPPTAHFRTKIFHPNVDPDTGAICVETLKRDWKPELTLRDILITINCLLICPNPSSALNAEAGMLIDEDYKTFEKRATLWTKIHATIPDDMTAKVEEARTRGEAETKEQKRVKGKERRLVETGEGGKASEEVENGFKLMGAIKDSQLFSTSPFHSTTAIGPTGLGLTTSMQSVHTITDMDLDDTPIQPPPPRRTRKRYALNAPPESFASSSAASFSQLPTTPTPAAPQMREHTEQQGPVTPRPPDAKRLRTSSPTPLLHHQRNQDMGNTTHLESTSLSAEEQQSIATEAEVYSWITWYKNLPPSPPISPAEKIARENAEKRRMEAAGNDIEKWNSGAFGVRIGIHRI